ncbi:MAG: Asp23/Gls24 family envelope stress response protein [Erysipelotrichaceae bacterium]|nr:Asp23/Gls24 family envelope stress response protein [Erysipelotrichaceae bacterium]
MAHNTEYYTYEGTPINGNLMMNVQVFDIIIKRVVTEAENVSLDTSKGFSMSGSKNLVNCTIRDNEVYITLHLKMKYGTNISAETKFLQKKLADQIKEITNVDVKSIDINVEGIVF